MTTAQRAAARADYLAARQRASNATARGDITGAAISAASARAILGRMIAADEADVLSRAATVAER